ncbi:sterol carrier protein domain-containing protein [Enterococcus plantarum]|nr:sterol carrier protein domain-containing protein [Enterococcus plantarum]
MGRIIDLEGFLLKYPIQVGNREVYYLKVADEYASWTEGIWELAIDEKGQGIV